MPGAAMSLNKDRLYRISDRLYAHRAAIERELAARERELFALEETIILYDLTSTYFEGVAANNEKAAHGYSRDHRSDRKQVVVGLVLDGEGFPKAHEVFAGNTKDQHTLAQMLDSLQHRMGGLAEGRATVVMDRGLATDENVALLRERGRSRHIVTTKQSERQELFGEVDKTRFEPVKVDEQGQTTVSAQLRRHAGELYVLCYSAARESKDRAIRERFARRFEEDAEKLKKRVAAGRLKNPEKINQAIGRLRERYPRVGRYSRCGWTPTRRTSTRRVGQRRGGAGARRRVGRHLSAAHRSH